MSERGVFGIDRGIWTDPDFEREPFTQREAWMWLISAAAFKDTRVRGKGPIDVKRGELCFSVRFLAEAWSWSKDRVHRFLKTLENRDMIRDTSRDGEKIYFIKNYNKFQIVGLPSRDTACDTERDTTATAARQRRSTETPKEESLGASRGEAPAEPELPIAAEQPKPARVKTVEGVERFDEFWSVFPKREGSNPRKPAFEAFRRELAKGADPGAIIAGARRLAAKFGGERSPYIPQAITWLNQRRWEDEAGPTLVSTTTSASPRPPQPVDDARWRQRLDWARERQRWEPSWGPLPGSPGSLVPERLVTPGQRQIFDEIRRAG